jgi:hypothetical protein
MKRKVVAVSAAALAVAGGGAAVAATTLVDPEQESKAVIDDAASQLGVQPSELSDALETALLKRVDAALAAGRITQAQADELKQRIRSGDYPLIGPMFGHRGGPGHGFGHVEAAAAYLGLTETGLRTQLESGKTMADVAKAQGKTVDGLVAALVADEKKELDEAVAAGRLTQAQADAMLADAKSRFTDMVNGTFPDHGPRGFRGAPPPDDASTTDA